MFRMNHWQTGKVVHNKFDNDCKKAIQVITMKKLAITFLPTLLVYNQLPKQTDKDIVKTF